MSNHHHQKNCPGCGRYTTGHATYDTHGVETWHWKCLTCELDGKAKA